MANFQAAPKSLLTHTPAKLPQNIKDILARAGTYTIFDSKGYSLAVPIGNTTWKGEQARLIGVLGGDEEGVRLDVTAESDIVDITLLSEDPVAKNLWVWIVQPKQMVGITHLNAVTRGKTPGRVFSRPLLVNTLAEVADAGPTGNFSGGDKQQTVDAIKDECARQGVTLNAQIAYILATAEHESGFTPIREAFSHERTRRGFTYYPYYGRGFVQLTHEGNYRTYSKLLGVDMVGDPDLAMQADIALYVLVHGMMSGTFGIKLPHYVNEKKTDFLHARHSVNVMDRAQHIADLAEKWLKVLEPPKIPGKK